MRSIFLSSLLTALSAVGCAANDQGAGVTKPARPPERVQKPTEPPVTDEVPQDLVARMRADLAGKVGDSKATAARIVQSQAVQWPDGAMGCPEPGMMYTQALVPGYRVRFQVDDEIYSYHAAQGGSFKLCPNDPRRVKKPQPIKEP
jgi:hypothetical protein